MGKLSGNIENFTFTAQGASADFKLARLDGEEAISTLYGYRLHLVSEDADIDLASLVSNAGAVKFNSEGGNVERYIHGMIARCCRSRQSPDDLRSDLGAARKTVVHTDRSKAATVRYRKPGGIVADEDTVYPFSYAEGVRTGSEY